MTNIKRPKQLVFKPAWNENVWWAWTLWGHYSIFKEHHNGYKNKTVYRLSVIGYSDTPNKNIHRVNFDDLVKIAQQHWEDKLSRIDECYE